jgi:hypothetical protein
MGSFARIFLRISIAMPKITDPLPWEFNPKEFYVPVLFKGNVIGFCKPDVAKTITAILNDNDKYRKALDLACYDLSAKAGGLPSAQSYRDQYIDRVERPKQGVGMIARLLQERQEDLDITDEEFAKFCDTFRLSRVELQNIYNGEDVDPTQFTALSRILGVTVEELMGLWKGKQS